MKTSSDEVAANVGRSTPLMIGIAVLSILIVLTGGTLGWYVVNRKPLSELPVISVFPAPAYSYSIPNVTRPIGVALDETNNRLYITQTSGTRLVKVTDLQGNLLGTLKPPADNALHTPVYIAIEPTSKDVYVSDRGSNEMYVYDKAGKYLRTLKPEGVKNWGPLAVAFAPDGTLYVADANATPQVVRVLKTDGTAIRTIGAAEDLSFVNGLAVEADGSIAVGDSNNARVLVYSAAGQLKGTLARGDADSPIGLPRGLAVSDANVLYIADSTNQDVLIYSPTSSGIPVYANVFGDDGAGDGQFQYPQGIATDTHGHIFVADRENNRVQVWTGR